MSQQHELSQNRLHLPGWLSLEHKPHEAGRKIWLQRGSWVGSSQERQPVLQATLSGGNEKAKK